MGRPKALLPLRGGTFLSVLAETLTPFCSQVVAVFGAEAETLIRHAPPGINCVTNPCYRLGMLTSLQEGLRALPLDECDAVLFTLVDHPAVGPRTIASVIAAIEASAAPIVIPRFRSTRGHPVIIRSAVIQEFLAEPPTSKVRDVIDRHAHAIEYVDVADPGICDDIDDPDLYRELIGREARAR